MVLSKPEKPSPFEALDAKLKVAQARRPHSKKRGGSDRDGIHSGIGIGMRMATEIVASVGVGVGMGLVLDSWLGTKPWLMLLFLLLGCGAAFLNVIRTALRRLLPQLTPKEASWIVGARLAAKTDLTRAPVSLHAARLNRPSHIAGVGLALTPSGSRPLHGAAARQ